MGKTYDMNPFTGQLEEVSKCDEQTTQTQPPFPYTRMFLGYIKDLDEINYNTIDACSLPATSNRQTIDLGTLDELCN